jgi:hypothetical protein
LELLNGLLKDASPFEDKKTTNTPKVFENINNRNIVDHNLLGLFDQQIFSAKLICSQTKKTTLTTLIITSTMFVPPIMVLLATNVLCIQLPKYHDSDDPMSHLQQLTKVCVTNGKNIEDHKLQYFPNSLKRKVDWFAKFETIRLPTTWDEVQQAFISRFSEV